MRKALQVPRTQRGIVRALSAAVLCLAFFFARSDPAAAATKAETGMVSSEAKALAAHAVDAANRRRWSDIHALALTAKDPVARALVTWLYLTADDTEPAFGEVTQFLAEHSDWPDRQKILRKAEKALPAGMSPGEVVAFFGTRAPSTGEGMVRLGEALIAEGNKSAGEALIKKGWIEGNFKPDREREIASAHRTLLRGAPTAARVDRLLWERRLSDAQRVLPDVDGDAAKLAQARITLMTSPSRADAVVSSLPRALQTDSGLIFEQVRAVGGKGDTRRALPLAIKADPSTAPNKWWDEREGLAREALAMGLYSEAYAVVKSHGLTSGADFADAEWLAGFIALRFLDKPDIAYAHFQTLLRGVNFPVSKARAAYWSGRAAEAGNKLAEATLMYEAAAVYSTTFYGQLAAVRLSHRDAAIELPPEPALGSAQRSAFLKDDVVRATALAATTGYEPMFKRFFLYLGERARSPEDYALAGEFARNLGYPQYAVRIAKKAMQDNIVLTALSYPVVSVPEQLPRGRAPEPALVLGVSRQESEFDASAVSRAGARGIMQLLPSTARLAARQQNIGYDANKLSDPAYNAKLGSAYLADLITDFGGSYPLAIAAYNAGPNRVRQWLAANGDPRDPKVDVIDWMELIPFSETRNYVQRVLENTQVYRGRLAGKPVLIRIAEDLSGPSSPNAGLVDLRSYRTVPAKAATARKVTPPATPSPAAETVASAEPNNTVPTPEAKPALEAPAPKPSAASLQAPPEKTTVASAKAGDEVPVPVMKPAPPQPSAAAAAPVATAKAAPEIKPAPPAQAAAAPPPAQAPPAAKDVKDVTVVASSEDTPEKEESAAPPANPFSGGQPETLAVSKPCMNMLMAKDGKLRCAERSASLP